MNSLLADVYSNKTAKIPIRGVCNGATNVVLPRNDHILLDDTEEYAAGIQEAAEYVKNEQSFYSSGQQAAGGLTDIIDGNEESILGSEAMETLEVPDVYTKYKFDVYCKEPLPIDGFKQKILDLINTNFVVIIHGPTGCGKTTQVPQYIVDYCREKKSACNIAVTQPRRIAAINIANRVCQERGWAIEKVCGYQVGLEKKVSPDVILTYMTTEVLLQKLIMQRNLNKFTHIIIDEVHERNKTLDFLLLIVRKYLFTNSSNVKVVLMSATMEAVQFSYYFRNVSRSSQDGKYLRAPILHVNKESNYVTNIYYTDQLAKAVPDYNISIPTIYPEQYKLCYDLLCIFDKLDEVDSTSNQKQIGSVLVFLPGYHEIEEMDKIMKETPRVQDSGEPIIEWDVIPLHSSLSSEHMNTAFQRAKPGRRKVILSTNIAESSVTVADVTYVIDFCLTKVMTVDAQTKFGTLSLEWASHNNCVQRAGRVGRVSNGRVYRLVPDEFYKSEMQANTIPEIQRAPLENIILYMKMLDLNDTPRNVLSLALDPPNLKDVENCIWHLKEIGALLTTCKGTKHSADGDITFLGRVMGQLPIDVHLSKMIVLGHMFSCLEDTIIMAAGATTRNLFVKTFYERLQCYRKKLVWADGSSSDFIALLTLYKVWFGMKCDRVFDNANAEKHWCRTNFVQQRGLKEMSILVKELENRLKRLRIEPITGPNRVNIDAVEKPLVLKVILCGAFYPNYFIRSSEFGQVDVQRAIKQLNGRDPFNTVYFGNMKPGQPTHIYVRQIKKLLGCDNVTLSFDGDSSKIFLEFKKELKQPVRVKVEGHEIIATIAGNNISPDLYEAIRKRQLKTKFTLRILPDKEAWAFADEIKLLNETRKITEMSEINCYSETSFSPLPTLDIQHITIVVSHIEDAGHFYCQNYDDETDYVIQRIRLILGSQVLKQVTAPIDVDGQMYCAKFYEDKMIYRCKVLSIVPGHKPSAYVIFVDYGNTQITRYEDLFYLPDIKDCHIKPIAMCCVLSEVQPIVDIHGKGIWSRGVNEIFKNKTENTKLHGKVYSVVDDVVHLELFLSNPNNRTARAQSFNEWLIEMNYGRKSEESYMSKADHELRLRVQKSENPSDEIANLNSHKLSSYSDFDHPQMSRATDSVNLTGPWSPLEMNVCGIVNATCGMRVNIDEDSVNTVLLDNNPEDPHARLLVAGLVGQSAISRHLNISQTTVMPNVKGLSMKMVLMFCPSMEPKITGDGQRVGAILCGLGYHEGTNQACFPMHDISLSLDTELSKEVINEVNVMRYYMSRSIVCMNNIYDEISYPEEIVESQKQLKSHLFKLLYLKPKSIDRVAVKHASIWNKFLYKDVEVLQVNALEEEQCSIWPHLWFVNLKDEDSPDIQALNKNLEDLLYTAKGLIDPNEIMCMLCKTQTLSSVGDVRIHLMSDVHKSNIEKHKTITTSKARP